LQQMEVPMKTMSAVTGVAFLMLAPGSVAHAADDMRGRQADVRKPGHYEWSWDGSDSLTIGVPATVRYTPEGPPRIVITGPDEFLSHIRLEKGLIGTNKRDCSSECAQMTITGITVRDITLAGAGRVVLEKLNLDRLRLTVAGGGSLTGSGRADQLDVAVAGSGSADLTHLAVRQANIDVAGSGSVTLTPREAANMSVSGSGTVHMASRPAKLTQSIVGPGGLRIGGK
jgi:hypothetical protein